MKQRSTLTTRLSPLALAAALALGSPALNAAPRIFAGPGSFWDVLANWTGGVLPGAADDAILGAFNTEVRTQFTINSFVGTGTLTVSNPGGLSFAAASSIGALQLLGGTLGGAGSLTVAGASAWDAGTMTGAGSTTFNGSLALAGNNLRDLTGARTLVTTGTTTWSNSAADGGRIRTGSAATISNSGSWLDQNSFTSRISNDFGGAVSTFANSGNYTKSGAGSTDIQIIFNNSGTVNLNAGSLRFSGGGTSSGSYAGLAGTTLGFGGGHSLQAASSINTAGALDFNGGSNTVAGAVSAAGGIGFSGSGSTTFTGNVANPGSSLAASGGTGIFNNAQALNVASLLLSSGGLTFNNTGGVTSAALTLAGGTLGGSAAVVVNGSSSWTSGAMAGSGSTTLNGALNVSGADVHDLTGGRTLNTAGTTTWTNAAAADSGRFRTGSGATLNNGGSWLDQTASSTRISNDFGGAVSTFANSGNYTKSGGGSTDIQITFNNSGTVNLNAGNLRFSGGGTSSSGSFAALAGTTLGFGGGHTLQAGTSINAAGTVDFSGGTNTVAGGYSAGTATTFSGSGTTTFSGNVAGVGSSLTASGGTGVFSNGQALNVSALVISAGGLSFNNTGGVTSGTLNLSGGALGGTAAVLVTGAPVWSGGTMTGTGSTTLQGNLLLDGTNLRDLTGGRTLNTQGSTSWTNAVANDNGRIRTGSGATINNSGSWLDQNNFNNRISNDFGGASSTFNNLGSYTKSGNGTTEIQVAFNNTSSGAGTGVVAVNAGTLRLSGGGSGNGSFTGAATLDFGGGTQDLLAGSSVNLANVIFSGGTTNVGGSYTVAGTTSVTGGTANFTGSVANAGGSLLISGGTANFSNSGGVTVATLNLSGGILTGTQNLTVNGPAIWTNGTMTGAGRTTTSADLTLSGAGFKDLQTGRILATAGTTTWSNTANDNGRIRTGSGVTINNTGSWLDQSAFGNRISPDFGGAASTFINAGSFRKTGTPVTDISIAFNNSGSVLVDAGTLRLSGGGNSGGSFSGAALLDFGGGTHDLTAASSVLLPNVNFSGGITNLAGAYTVSGSTTVNGGVANFVGTVANAGGNLVISSGTGNFSNSAGVVMGTLNMSGGSLGGTQNLDITGASVWSAGAMTGAGRTTTQGTLTLAGNGLRDIQNGRLLVTAGTTTWTNTAADGGRIRTGAAATVRNTGSWLDQTAFNTRFSNDFGGAQSTYNNLGSYTKSGSGSTDFAINFDNGAAGVVNLNGGTLASSAGGSSTGLINLAAGTTLNFSGGTFSLDGSVAADAASRVLASGATLNTVGSKTIGGLLELSAGTINANAATSVASYLQSAGTLGGSGNVTIGGNSTWSAGAMTGAATTTMQGALLLSGNGLRDIQNGRVVVTAGTTTWSNTAVDGGRIRTGSAATVRNTGSWLDQANFNIRFSNDFGGAQSTFSNQGTYTKSGSGSTEIGILLDNAATGVINVNSSTLNLSGGGSSTGLINLAAGTTLAFSTGTFTLDGSLAALAGSRVLVSGAGVTTVGPKTIAGLLELSGGVLTANAATSVGSYLQSGGTLGGTGNLTVGGPATWTSGLMTGVGTTTTADTLALSGSAGKDITNGRTLVMQGTSTWSNTAASNGFIRTGSAATLRNEGRFVDASAFSNRIGNDFGGAIASFLNPGTYAKTGAGATDIGIIFSNTGTVSVTGGILSITGTFSNFAGSTLSGGTVEVIGNSSFRFAGANVVTNASGILLDGAGSTFLNANTSANGLASFATNAAAGSFTIRNGRNFNTSGGFGNAGLLAVGSGSSFTVAAAQALNNSGSVQLAGGTLAASGLYTNTGVTVGFGNVQAAITNGGLVRASGGTLAVSGGVQGSGGDVGIVAGATLDLGGSSLASSARVLDDAGSLNLGAQNIVVAQDYVNANFGSGNSFAARAGVSGAGQIVGQNAAQTLTGAVTPAGANAFVLDFGNVRGGSSSTRTFQIANSGSGASIRGALQTGGPGLGQITDPRLTGSGVNAFTFGPIAAGANGGNLSITLAAGAAGGALAGQSLALVSNFGNVATQTLQLSGFSTVLAQGAVNPAGPLDLGHFRVGRLPELGGSLGVSNLTTGAGAEQLGILSVSSSGSFSASNLLGAGLLAPGASAAGAVAVNTAAGGVGLNNGSVSVQFASNGSLFDASFGTLATNQQTVALSATGYLEAQPLLPLAPVNVGNFRLSTGASGSFVVTNNNLAPAGFQELLNASVGSTSAGVTLSGSATGLAPGASSAPFSIGFAPGGGAGPRSGSGSIVLVSDGAGTSGLGQLSLGSGTVSVSGTAFNLAVGDATPAPVLVSNQRQGGVGGGASSVQLVVANIAPAGLFSEALNASFAGLGGSASSNGGSFVNLAAGAVNNSAMVVSVDNSQAGHRVGSATLAYQTDGTGSNGHSGLAAIGAGSQTLNISGDVFRLASASNVLPSASIVLPNQRVGGTLTQALSFSNVAAADGFSEALNASIAASGSATAGGSFNLLAPGASSNALFVGVNTGAAGAQGGTATITLASDGTGSSGFAAFGLGTQQVQVSGDVYRLAVPLVDTTPITLAARVGDAAPQRAIGVSNNAPAQFTERLDASITGTPAGFSGSGVVSGLAGGASSNALGVGLNTGTAGSFAGNASVALVSSGVGTTNAPDAALGTASVALTGRVYAPAVAQVNTPTTVDFGIVRVGDVVAARNVSISNTASGALTDTLRATLSGGNAPFTAAGTVAGLAAGANNATALTVQLATGNAGVFNGSANIAFTSQNPDLADLALAGAGITLHAQVNNLAQAALAQAGGSGSLAGAGASYTLNFGAVQLGSGALNAALRLGNAASGTADALAGLWDLSGISTGSAFTLSGFGSFAGLLAGSTLDGLGISFDSGLEGSFDSVLVLHSLSTNGSGPDLALGDVTLRLQGTVVAVPEPGTAVLWVAGLLLLVRLSRRRLPQAA